jgi:hypothetical protein
MTALNFDFEVNKVKLSSFKPVRFDTIGDGNCYFHAILSAIYKDYDKVDKRSVVKDLRKELSEELEQKYNTLSRGQLSNMSKELDFLKLDTLKKHLASSLPVGNEFQELVSNIFDIDIYMFELARKDVLIMSGDDEILYKKRNSVVLISTGNHYEIVGIPDDKGAYIKFFSHDHPFIKFIGSRIEELRKNKK